MDGSALQTTAFAAQDQPTTGFRFDSMTPCARRSAATISIGCIYSGRLPGLLPEWLLKLAINAHGLTTQLAILDNSDADPFSPLENAIWCRHRHFSRLSIVPHHAKPTWTNEIERQHAVASFMASATQRLLSLCTGDLVWLVEDDVLPPSSALDSLLRTITEVDGPVPAAASGVYRNRHEGAPPAFGWYVCDVANRLAWLPEKTVPVDLAGAGCLLLWRELAPTKLDSHLGAYAAHDWALTMAMRRAGREVLLDPRVKCRHYKTETEWV